MPRFEEKMIAADLAYSALDLADRIIERATGMDTPKEWNDAYRAVAKARQKASRAAIRSSAQEKTDG